LSDLAFFFSHHFEVDGRRGKAGMSHPSLNKVQRDAVTDSMNTKAMPQTLRRRVKAGRNLRIRHDGLDELPSAAPGPSPQPGPGAH